MTEALSGCLRGLATIRREDATLKELTKMTTQSSDLLEANHKLQLELVELRKEYDAYKTESTKKIESLADETRRLMSDLPPLYQVVLLDETVAADVYSEEILKARFSLRILCFSFDLKVIKNALLKALDQVDPVGALPSPPLVAHRGAVEEHRAPATQGHVLSHVLSVGRSVFVS